VVVVVGHRAYYFAACGDRERVVVDIVKTSRAPGEEGGGENYAIFVPAINKNRERERNFFRCPPAVVADKTRRSARLRPYLFGVGHCLKY